MSGDPRFALYWAFEAALERGKAPRSTGSTATSLDEAITDHFTPKKENTDHDEG
ncbi:hypothetical protein [Gordonia sp. SL306]|uniref:hypothetical protein n=1 Tax=Gordonia sp. SL306 TaxID=2995145 RepID=UPI002271A83A|nr:hypothetical protein [Gordonia sp. SL306]WAC54265.1 hypothetical protein OVA31_16430 [Gordonia sp. SL306]